MSVLTGTSLLGIDPAKGTILWRYTFGNQFKTNCAQSGVVTDNTLFISAALRNRLCRTSSIAKNTGGEWEVKEKWRDKKLMQTLHATSMILDKKIYGVSGDLSAIFLRCLDLETGKMQWEERLPERAHLLEVDGRMLVWEEHGRLRYLEVNPTAYKSEGEIPGLLTFKSWAAPALAGGKLYLRDERNVLCLDLR